LAADDNVTDFQRTATEHQTGAHAESTDPVVVLGGVTPFSFKQALNAVKSKPPSCRRRPSESW
jgi:hypothetical protein